MSLTGRFQGEFRLDKPLTNDQLAYLSKFAHTRRMKRSAAMLEHEPDLVREAVGLPLGAEGAYYVGSTTFFGQDFDSPSVVDPNHPPEGQPGLICQWVPNSEGTAIEWNGSEKIDEGFVRWIQYFIEHFLEPWGCTVNGTVQWQTNPYPFGSEMTLEFRPAISRGDIVITDNEIEIRNEKLEWL